MSDNSEAHIATADALTLLLHNQHLMDDMTGAWAATANKRKSR